MLNNISIIGCGQAALALAAYFANNKLRLTLYADHGHKGASEAVKRTGKIKTIGLLSGTWNVQNVTYSIEEALLNSLIFIVLPTYAHDYIFEKMLPFLRDDHIIVTVTGNFSSLYFYNKIRSLNNSATCSLVDINLFPFACRLVKENMVNIIGLKKKLTASVLPKEKTDFILTTLNDTFPAELIGCSCPLECALNNVNGICHPAILILNAGRIGRHKSDFYFNRDGVTKTVAGVLEALDNDRIQIGKWLGFELLPFLKVMKNFYGESFTSMYDFFQNSSILNAYKLCPQNINCRYMTEDIQYLFVPWQVLADKIGYKTLALSALINMACVLTRTDYFSKGRDLEQLTQYSELI